MAIPAILAAGALGVGSGIASSFSNSGGVKSVADPYGGVRNSLNDWLQGQIGKPGPLYSGQITAPMSSQQERSLGMVDSYAGNPLTSNATFGDATNFENGLLTDNFDPSTSPYYSAIKAGANTNLQDELNGINSDAGGAGAYFTGARMKQDQRARTNTTNTLNQTLAGLQQQNEQNKIASLPMASSLASAANSDPLQKATALQTLGALPQELQQNTNNALLNEFYQSQYQYPLSVGSLAAGVQQPPLYQQNTNQAAQGIGAGLGAAGSTVGSLGMLSALGYI